jgi:hypothetical protein
MIVATQIGGATAPTDADEALSARLRDLALVDLDALGSALVGAYADDVVDALREARGRIGELRGKLAGPDPLNVLEASSRQRASDAGHAGAARVRDRLVGQADAARAMARLAELASTLVPKLFEAERRR